MFYERLIMLCKAKNIKISNLLIEIETNGNVSSRWKNGAIPTGEKLIKLADYFNVSVDYLLGRMDKREVNR